MIQRGLRFSRRHKRAVWTAVVVCACIVSLQFLYPSSRTLPFTRLGGDTVGGKTTTSVAALLQASYSNLPLTAEVHGKTTASTLAESGIIPNNEAIMHGLTGYPWYQRLVPFSLLKGLFINQPVAATVDEERFALFAKELAKECAVAPHSAGVVVKNDTVQLDPAKNGAECTQASVQRQLTAQPLTKKGIHASITAAAITPGRSDKDVQPLLDEAQAVASRQVTLVVGGKPYVIDKPTLASWLEFPADPKTKQIKIDVNDQAVQAYLATVQKDAYIAPGVTTIHTLDSIETGREVGDSGVGIDMAATTASLHKQVLVGSGTVRAVTTIVPPTVSYDRHYSDTPAGLQSLINDLAAGKDVAISVRRLGDTGVSVNGDKQYAPASTYKLFVAYSILKRVDDGRMSWGQATTGGQTLSQCFDNMIVNSDNTCAEWFGETIGWNTVSNEARSLGASNTVLSRPFVSTANDVALFLQKLESNQLGLSENSRGRLLDAMKRQVYRKGIPAGLAGITVADKVGFLDALLHDAAIVYAPSGVYVMVIYTNNSSWGQIAAMASQIQAHLQ